jgi:hypothetical protein
MGICRMIANLVTSARFGDSSILLRALKSEIIVLMTYVYKK